jgi:hypothetical protein
MTASALAIPPPPPRVFHAFLQSHKKNVKKLRQLHHGYFQILSNTLLPNYPTFNGIQCEVTAALYKNKVQYWMFELTARITLKLYLFAREVTASASSKWLYNELVRIRSSRNKITPLFTPGKPWSLCDDRGSPNLKSSNPHYKQIWCIKIYSLF